MERENESSARRVVEGRGVLLFRSAGGGGEEVAFDHVKFCRTHQRQGQGNASLVKVEDCGASTIIADRIGSRDGI